MFRGFHWDNKIEISGVDSYLGERLFGLDRSEYLEIDIALKIDKGEINGFSIYR